MIDASIPKKNKTRAIFILSCWDDWRTRSDDWHSGALGFLFLFWDPFNLFIIVFVSIRGRKLFLRASTADVGSVLVSASRWALQICNFIVLLVGQWMINFLQQHHHGTPLQSASKQQTEKQTQKKKLPSLKQCNNRERWSNYALKYVFFFILKNIIKARVKMSAMGKEWGSGSVSRSDSFAGALSPWAPYYTTPPFWMHDAAFL